jgi:hypothetical protein
MQVHLFDMRGVRIACVDIANYPRRELLIFQGRHFLLRTDGGYHEVMPGQLVACIERPLTGKVR